MPSHFQNGKKKPKHFCDVLFQCAVLKILEILIE